MIDIRYLKLIILSILFILSFIFVLLPYKILSIAQSRQSIIQRRIYETVFSMLNCFAAGVFLATCFLDLLPEVRYSMLNALKLYNFPPKAQNSTTNNDEEDKFPFPEFVVILGVFLILTIEQAALVFKERYLKREKLSIKNNTTQFNRETEPLIIDCADQICQKKPTFYGSIKEETRILDNLESSINLRPSTSLLHKICGSIDIPTPSSEKIATPNTDTLLQSSNKLMPDFDRTNSTYNNTDQDDSTTSKNRSGGSNHNNVTFATLFEETAIRDGNSCHDYKDQTNLDDNDNDGISTTIRNRPTSSSQYHHHHHHPVHHLAVDPECGHPSFRLYILVLSLAIHSLFEGIAVALQPTPSAIIGLFGALCFHKVTVAFSLGLNLVQSSMKLVPQILVCGLIFASMSPLGIALSFLLDSSPGNSNNIPISTTTASLSTTITNPLPIYNHFNHSRLTHPPKDSTALKFLFSLASNLREMTVYQNLPPSQLIDNLVEVKPKPWVLLTSAVLQGIACGTFLYITFFELLPHEMNSGKNRLLKVAFLVLGYGFVTGFIVYDTL